eukprot:gene20457-26543_t
MKNSFPQPKFSSSTPKMLAISGPLAIAGIALAIEGYARIPQKYLFNSLPHPLPNLNYTKDILIIFPGAGGPDEYTDALYNTIIKSDKEKGIDRYVHCYDWSKWVGNLIRAAYDSESVGRTIGNQVSTLILSNNSISSNNKVNVHAIGISVGAFAAYAFTKALSFNCKDLVYTRSTLLDPFTSKGIFGPAYGPKQFGKEESVNYCEHYVNTDDPVPTTNEPLPYAVTYDVTDSESRKFFVPRTGDSMHSWPVMYLVRNWKTETDSKGRLTQPTHQNNPRGRIIKITK